MGHSHHEHLLPLIGRIYDASLDARIWGEVATEVAEIQGAPKALLFSPLTPPAQGGFVYPVGISESALQQWADCYVQHDVWSQAGMAKGLIVEGKVVLDEELVPQEEFLRSVMYREFLSKQDIARVCTGIVYGMASQEPAMPPPAVMAVYRGLNARAFGERERRTHTLIIPHLSRALGIMYRLRDAELRVAATLAALDRLASGVLLIGEGREVCFANRAAQTLLGAGDGLRLRADGLGRSWLHAASPDAQRAVDAALDACLAPDKLDVPHFSQALTMRRTSGRPGYTLQMSALPRVNEFGTGPQSPQAIVFLSDPARSLQVDEALLRKLYGLTPAECRLAVALCPGETVASVSAQFGVSVNAARCQLQSIFDKTGTRRQAQLVKLMLSLASQES